MADPLARLARIRNGLTPAEWATAGAMAAVIIGLNVLGGYAGRRGRRALPHHRQGALRVRHRHPGLHPGHAPRLRRRPHRRDRQHHPQAGPGRQTAPERRLLLLPRPLHRRVRAGGAAQLRHPRPRHQVKNDSSGLHHTTGIIGTPVSGHLPISDRPAEPDRAGLHPQGVPGDAPGQIRRRRAGDASSTIAG